MAELSFRTGQPRWMDMQSRDIDASVAFYTGLFGWTAEPSPPEYGGYVEFSKDGNTVAGIMPRPSDSTGDDAWIVYLEVADAAATQEAARANGGEVVAGGDLGEVGTWFVLTDATGARIGGWQNGNHSGFQVRTGPGAPVWHELHTRDFSRAVSFYETVFGWQTEAMSDTPEFRFTTLGSGDDAVAGIYDATAELPEIEPAFWDVYFGVENANDSAVRVTELGGTMLERVEETPYGRLAHAVDPNGGRFAIMQEP